MYTFLGHFFPEEGNEFFEKVRAWNERQDAEQVVQDDNEQAESEKMLYVHPEDKWQHMPLDETAYRFWCQGIQSTQNLLRIRKLWDYHLVQDDEDAAAPYTLSSRLEKVPPTWVTPSPPANWIWATYLTH